MRVFNVKITITSQDLLNEEVEGDIVHTVLYNLEKEGFDITHLEISEEI